MCLGFGGTLEVNAVEGSDDDGEDKLESADSGAGNKTRQTTHVPVLSRHYESRGV